MVNKLLYYQFLRKIPTEDTVKRGVKQGGKKKKKKKNSRSAAAGSSAGKGTKNNNNNNDSGNHKMKNSTKENGNKGKGKAEKEIVTFNVKKSENFAEWYEQIVRFGEIMDKRFPVKGMPIFRPYGYYIHHAIMDIIGEEWEKQGIERALFPLLIPEEFLKLEGEHVAGFEDEVYWVTHGGKKPFKQRKLLRPTSETVIYYMFQLWITSVRDLPMKVHQTCNVFRYETKQTRPLIRAREIHWNEAHTAHATPEDALENLEAAWKSYLYLINDCCCFYGLRLRRPEWDKFPGSVHTDVMDSVMPCGRVLQTVGAHFLGTKFAKAFNIRYTDHDGEARHPHLTCYGISTRLLAALISIHGDDSGLVLPPRLARYQVVIVPIIMKNRDAPVVNKTCLQVQRLLQDANIRTFFDDSAKKPGPKFYYHEMKGVPIRIEVGPRDVTRKCVTMLPRDQVGGKKSQIDLANLVPGIQDAMEQMTTRLQTAAKKFHSEQITTCTTIDQVKAAIATGGFARVPFVTCDLAGEDGDKIIHAACGGEVRGSLVDEVPPPEGSLCVATGKSATVWGYVARSY